MKRKIVVVFILLMLSVLAAACGLSEEEKIDVKKFYADYPNISSQAKTTMLSWDSYPVIEEYMNYFRANDDRLSEKKMSGMILGYFWKGMTKKDVEMSVGKPDSTYKSGNYEAWTYESSSENHYSSTTMYFYDGVLDHWDKYNS